MVKAAIDRTDRKLGAPEETLNLDSHVVDQEFDDEKVAERLADEMMGQDSPVLSDLLARPTTTMWSKKSASSAARFPIR